MLKRKVDAIEEQIKKAKEQLREAKTEEEVRTAGDLLDYLFTLRDAGKKGFKSISASDMLKVGAYVTLSVGILVFEHSGHALVTKAVEPLKNVIRL